MKFLVDVHADPKFRDLTVKTIQSAVFESLECRVEVTSVDEEAG